MSILKTTELFTFGEFYNVWIVFRFKNGMKKNVTKGGETSHRGQTHQTSDV